MNKAFLVDTHALLWWWLDDPRLSNMARKTLSHPEHRILVSSVSAWEVSTKYRLGRLPHAADIVQNFSDLIRLSRFEALSIRTEHALEAGQLPVPHRDPFDRMLAAQAKMENLPLISSDPAFKDFQIMLIW